SRLEVQVYESGQHEERTENRIHKELERNRNSACAAPNGCDKVDWNQGHFPEEVEQERVHRHKYTSQARLHKQYQRIEHVRVLVVVLERGKDDQGHQEGSQEHHQEADAVHTNAEAYTCALHPRYIEGELCSGIR